MFKKKADRAASLHKEQMHEEAIAQLCEKHALDIEAAFALTDEETNTKLVVERLRLMAEKKYCTNLKKERKRSSDKLSKERDAQKAFNDHSHKQWILKLARNLSKQKKAHQSVERKLQEKFEKKEEEHKEKLEKKEEKHQEKLEKKEKEHQSDKASWRRSW